MFDILVSLVIYKTPVETIRNVLFSFLNSNTKLNIKVCVLDNNNDLNLKFFCRENFYDYISFNVNLGFGVGHNSILLNQRYNAKCFLIINPDVFIDYFDLEGLYNFIIDNKDAGLVAPRLFNEDNSLQKSCRLLPSPLSLIFRNIKLLSFLDNEISDYEDLMTPPSIHGACYLVKSDIFYKINGFDERFFMYMEDIDFCRRINMISKIFYLQKYTAIHTYQKGTFKSLKLFYYHLISAILYFNKWGWLFDNKRFISNKLFMKN